MNQDAGGGILKVSLCVASLGDTQALRDFRDGLASVKTAFRWELVLVVNGGAQLPGDDSFWADLPCDLRFLYEPLRGKGRALNRAIEVAGGELLVFTDDDVLVTEHWLERLVAAADARPCGAVFGGRILARGRVPDWIRRSFNLQRALLCEQDYGIADMVYPSWQYPLGPNMAVRAAAVRTRTARWLESIGPGTQLPVGDESAFLSQLSAPEAQDRHYVAGALVFHRVDGRYFPLTRAVRRAYQVGLSAGKLAANRSGAGFSTGQRGQSFARLLAKRLRGLGSLRELICVVARAFGVFLGSRILKRY